MNTPTKGNDRQKGDGFNMRLQLKKYNVMTSLDTFRAFLSFEKLLITPQKLEIFDISAI